MEYSIDRSSYRRNANIETNNDEGKKLIYIIIKRLLIQSLASVIILITIYTIKIMKLKEPIEWLKEETNKDVPISVAYDVVKSRINSIYTSLIKESEKENEELVDNVENNAENEIVENNNQDSILSVQTEEPIENTYEEAVEGINQMSEDAQYIKENYKLIYPIQGTVTSRFGVRVSDNPIVTPYHSGIDLAANTGTKIQSALSGQVIYADTSEAYGKHIMIQTDDVIILYAHCSKLNVKVGQEVKQGAIIGEVGSTGWATGPHLHFEIRYKDRLVNPANILDFGE